MKKLKSALVCFSALLIFSCATSSVPETAELPAVPQIEQEIEEPQETADTDEEPENFLEELEDIEEPVVIDLEPEDIQSEENGNNDSDENSGNEDVSGEETEEPSYADSEDNIESVDEENSVQNEVEMMATESNSSETVSDVANEASVNADKNEITAENAAETDSSENADSIEQKENESTEDSSDEEASDENAEIIPEATPSKPSRSVSLKVLEYLDVTYPGKGWVFLGATDNSKDIVYFGRRLGTEDTNFSLQARQPGTKILHFTKNDAVTGEAIDDYLEVKIISEKGSPSNHVAAPAFKMPVKLKKRTAAKTPEMEEKTSENEESALKTQNAASKPAAAADTRKSTAQTQNKSVSKKSQQVIDIDTIEDVSEISTENYSVSEEENTPAEINSENNAEQFLSDAKASLTSKDYKNALKNINLYIQSSTDNNDEALYILGQILEAKSEVQNISEAINTYTTLTKNYPASKFWDSANKRIIYLKRFYLQGR